MENVLALLPFLALLACPIMMGVCFFAMRRMEGDVPATGGVREGYELPEERVAASQQERQAMQAELTALQGRHGPATAATAREAPQPVDSVPGPRSMRPWQPVPDSSPAPQAPSLLPR